MRTSRGNSGTANQDNYFIFSLIYPEMLANLTRHRDKMATLQHFCISIVTVYKVVGYKNIDHVYHVYAVKHNN